MRVLLTGNSRGIGAAIQADLEAHGHRIYGTHGAVAYQAVATYRYNIAESEDIELLLDDAASALGGLDILINNAGILDSEPFGQLTVAGIEKVFRVNVVAPLLLAQGAVGMGAKLIIMVGSLYGVTGAYGAKPTYAASKAALHNSTVTLARALGPQGVRVVAIAPGIVPTGIHDNQGGLAKHGATGHSCVGRMGTAVEVAHAVRFVMDNAYVNGTIIEVSGGR